MKIEEHVDSFLNTMSDKYGGYAKCHNVYVIQSIDKDGNVTETKYGLNIMTDYGFETLYTDKNTLTLRRQNCNIFLGNNPDNLDPDPTRKTLYNRVIGSSATILSSNNSFLDTLYDSENGLIISRMYRGSYQFDYNVNDVNNVQFTSDVELTEIGLGSAYNTLISHSRIYDRNGNVSSITKRINEKLTIYLYMNYTMKASVMDALWDNSVYGVIVPGYYGFTETQYYTENLRPVWFKVANSATIPLINSYGDNMFQKNSTGSFTYDSDGASTWSSKQYSKLYEDQRTLLTWYGFGHQSTTNVINDEHFLFRHIELSEPEEVTFNHVYTACIDDPGLDYQFLWTSDKNTYGNYSYFPLNQLHITSLTRYNFITNEFDIPVPFHDAPDRIYDRTFYKHCGDMYVTCPDGVKRLAYIYANPYKDQVSITVLPTTGETIYATDAYWDISSWQAIPNTAAIPTELQRMKYYISTASTAVAYTPKMFDWYDGSRDVIGDHHYVDLDENDKPFELNETCEHVSSSSHLPDYYANDQYGYIVTDGSTIRFTDSTGNTITSEIDLGSFLYNCTVDPDYNNTSTVIGGQYCATRHDNAIKHGKYLIYPELSYVYRANGYRATRTGSRFRIFDMSIEDPTYENLIATYRRVDLNWVRNTNSAFNQWYSTFEGSKYLTASSSSTYSEGIILNLETLEQYHMDHNQQLRVMYGTEYCFYIDTVANYGEDGYTAFKYIKIMDMNTHEIVDEFEFPEDGYTLHGMVGFDGHIYLLTSAGTSNMIYHYDMNDKSLTIIDNPFYSLSYGTMCSYKQYSSAPLQNENSKAYNTASNWHSYKKFTINGEDIGILTFLMPVVVSGATFLVIFSISTINPNQIVQVSQYDYSKAGSVNTDSCCYHGFFVNKIDNNIFLSYQCYGSNGHNFLTRIVLDLGYILKNGTYIAVLPTWHYKTNWKWASDYYRNHYFTDDELETYIPYKGRILGFRLNGSSAQKIKSYPIEYFSRMKLTGTTKSFQCWNNPKRLSNLGMSMTATNHSQE